ncbi:hypothetical protein V5H16_17100 [Vibrio cholerae]|uniref:hypothetical protein n=1 Tax=Vibrio cholerae TaxID=666 RepID=UPI0039670D58
MKRSVFTFKVFLIVFFLFVPFVVYINSDCLSLYLDKSSEAIEELVKVIIPLFFSISILIINTILSDWKDAIEHKKIMISKYNSEISNYNVFVLCMQKMLNERINYYTYLEKVFTWSNLEDLHDIWCKISQVKSDVRNDNTFMACVDEVSHKISMSYIETGEFKNFLEAMAHLRLPYKDTNFIDCKLEAFICNFATKYIEKRHSRTIVHFAAHLSTSQALNAFIDEFNKSVDVFSGKYKSNSDMKVALSSVILNMFNLYEMVIFESFVHKNAMSLMFNAFSQYINGLDCEKEILDIYIATYDSAYPISLEDKYNWEVIKTKI